jgi:hypothetical protein
MMPAPRSWKDKLPSIAGTLAIQAAFAVLLLFSITAVRQAEAPVETIFLLPRPKPEPIVIDARQPPESKKAAEQAPPGAAPGPPSQLPAYALPAQTLAGYRQFATSALVRSLIQSFNACRKKEGEDRPVCPGAVTQPDPRIVTLEDKDVKEAEIWQGEIDRRNAPFALPGAGAGPLGVLLSALVNPGAFSDPKAYSAVSGPPERVSGAEALQRRRYNTPNTSLNGTNFENRIRLDSAGAVHYGK